MKLRRIGIDIGGVIINRHYEPGDVEFFEKDYLLVPMVTDAFDGIRSIVARFGNTEVFLVSSCTEIVETNTLAWFEHHDFFEKTGVLRTHLRFCRTRDLKAPICKDLEISDFIDDRQRVLRSLTTVENLYHFNPTTQPTPTDLIHLPSWKEIQTVLK